MKLAVETASMAVFESNLIEDNGKLGREMSFSVYGCGAREIVFCRLGQSWFILKDVEYVAEARRRVLKKPEIQKSLLGL